MSWVNDMVTMMRQDTGSGSSGGLKLALMTGPDSCKVGNLELKKEDLLFADHLTKQVCTKVAMTAPSGGGTCTDKSIYLSALKAGDMVVVSQISDDKFLVIERMVSL